MTAAHQNPPTKPTVQVTMQQACAIATLEADVEKLRISANVVGGFLGLFEAGDIYLEAMRLMDKRKNELALKWGKSVVLASPGDLPKLVNP